MGAFPRVAQWDGDGRKDLLVGDANGQITLFLNTGSDAAPLFGAGVLLEVGPAGGKAPIDVGIRATPLFLDWDGDGRRDLVVGAYDGRIHLFLNSGTDTAPDFLAESFAQSGLGDLVVDSVRSSPVVMDLDEDGRKDLISGNTEGQVLFFRNTGSDTAPVFAAAEPVEAAGLAIDFSGVPRSRPFICDWTGDGYLDLLVGIGDGRVHLFQGSATAVASLPPAARLGLPWPNPANPRVNLTLAVERAGDYRVRVLDAAGRHVITLHEGFLAAGTKELTWSGRDAAGHDQATGLYLIRLEGVRNSEPRKIMLLR